jgi:predicted acyltransferase
MKPSHRLLSLDVFRGLTIAGMILVNDAGDWGHVYPALEHAPWHGVTPTDLIFPFFLFIVGVAITLSTGKRMDEGASKAVILRHAFVRALTIFAIGVFLYAVPAFDVATMRIPGVLQRIAIVYFLCTVLYLGVGRTALLWCIALCLIPYWIIMLNYPVPGGGAANLTQEGNLSAVVDRSLLNGHLWYLTRTWDPEGVLSTIPSIATGLLGLLAGYVFRGALAPQEKVNRFFVWGCVLTVAGTIADIWFPINKNLWSPSYVLFTGGMALFFLAFCYYLIDVRGYRGWVMPFRVFGTNAIFAYCLASLLSTALYTVSWADATGRTLSLQEYIFRALFATWLSPFNASVAFACLFVLITWAVTYVLYVRNIFLKV